VQVKVEENGKGSDYGFYSVTLLEKKTNIEVNMDLTKKGGYPIWYLNNREVKQKKLDLNQAFTKAESFLKNHKFDSLELFESSQYDQIGLFSFVTLVDGVRVYPDSVKVKIALDDGSIMGFSADEYLQSHKLRKIDGAKLSLKE